MKTLVIGNGSSTKDFELGKKIDSDFDVVVRFNRGYFEGINNYEKYIGSKTNILIVHDGFATKEWLTDKVLDSVDYVLVSIPLFKFSAQSFRINSLEFGDKVQIIQPYYEEKLRKMVNFGSKWPTTGLIGLSAIVNHYDDVTIFGFDGGNLKYEYYHYFGETSHKRTSKYMNRDNRPDHNLSAENICIETIIQQNKLKILTNE